MRSPLQIRGNEELDEIGGNKGTPDKTGIVGGVLSRRLVVKAGGGLRGGDDSLSDGVTRPGFNRSSSSAVISMW